HRRVEIDIGRRLAGDPVAFLEALDALARLGDLATELVAEDDRDFHRPRLRVVVLVDVAAADADAADAQQDLVLPDLGPLHLAELDRALLHLELNDCGHLCHGYFPFTRFTKFRIVSKSLSASAPGLSS